MIYCKDITKYYKKKLVIEKSNLKLKTNQISFLMGPNGSGKTTFIKCTMNLESCEGNFVFDNKEIKEVREKCLVIWDDCPFYTNLSGYQNLLIFSEGRQGKEEINTMALKYLDESLLKRKVKSYSYGQKKKLGLILVEILEPEYLVMDEISNGLDYDSMRLLQKRMKKWSKK